MSDSDPSSSPTRRQTLQGLGVAAMAPLVPGCAAEGEEPEPTPAETPEVTWELLRERIDHVVVLMMENRSFDHYMGALSLHEGRDDVNGLAVGMSNPHPDGYDVPPVPSETPCEGGVGVGWDGSREQWNGGLNDGFVRKAAGSADPARHDRAMRYFDRDTIQTYYALADRYTLCDNWFASVMSSTWPNRFYSHAGQNGGMQGNDHAPEPFPTVYTKLADKGIDWACYYSNLPALALTPDRSASEPNFQPIEDFYLHAQLGILPPVTVVEPVWGRSSDHPDEHPVNGQIFAATIYDALATSPAWDRTLFILTYDEHGGFYDHVPPPTVPDDRADEGFGQLGFRVPSLLVGPWVKPSACVHTQFEHTSILAFLAGLFELEPMTTRSAAANDLRDCFDAQAMVDGRPLGAETLPPIEWPAEDLERPECGSGDFWRDEGGGVPGMIELDDFDADFLAGSPKNRWAETDLVHRFILDRARTRGLWNG